MFGNPMLDVAIGLIFFYLLLSIIVTVLQEFIASFLKLRNKNLLVAIGELIGEGNKQAFFEHPLIYPLFRGEVQSGKPDGNGPAYIPSRNFALAILDLQGRKDVQGSVRAVGSPGGAGSPGSSGGDGSSGSRGRGAREPAFNLARFFTDAAYGAGLRARLDRFAKTAQEVIGGISNDDIKAVANNALLGAVGELKTATDVVDTAVKELENLFNSSMDRATGWYKVQAQRIALLISVLLAALLNADSIYVGQRLWGDEALRNQAVAAAEAYYQSRQGQQQLTSLCSAVGTEAAAKTGATESDADQWQTVKDCTQREIQEAMDQLTAAGYPIGWGWQDQSAKPQNEDGTRLSLGYLRGQPNQTWPGAILGILLTGLAVSLGSSFWFDLLGKFMNVRMTGKREDTATAAPERPSAGETSRTDSRPSQPPARG